MVCKLVYPHSVFELSAVPILAWSGGGVPGLLYVSCAVTVHCTACGGGGDTGKTMTGLPPPPWYTAYLFSTARVGRPAPEDGAEPMSCDTWGKCLHSLCTVETWQRNCTSCLVTALLPACHSVSQLRYFE